jgi:hypothetical protein
VPVENALFVKPVLKIDIEGFASCYPDGRGRKRAVKGINIRI